MARTQPSETQIAFGNLKTKTDLAFFLGVKPGLVRFLLYGRDADNYSSITILKRDGGKREIRSPIFPLKKLQRLLAAKLSEVYQPKSCVMGYVKDRNILQNAKKHKGKRWVLRVDLENFFGTINFGRVRGLFLSIGMCKEVATCAAQICCDKNILPQGAPTSPVISNMLCMKLDRQLSKMSRHNGVTYTRYVDDLVFSTHKREIPESHYVRSKSEIGVTLNSIIVDNGFVINQAKTKVSDRLGRQMVTGIVVNDSEGVPREKVRELRQQIFYANKYGIEEVGEKYFAEKDSRNRLPESSPDFLSVLRGKLEFIKFVRGETDAVYARLASDFAKLDDTYPVPQATFPRIQLIFEGESELVYFRSAFKALQKSCCLRMNPKLSFRSGDSALVALLRVAEDYHPNDLTICIFDHDSRGIIKKVRDTEGRPVKWGTNLFSTTISKPDFRAAEEFICAEFLFTDSDILQWHDGYRMFFSTEFNSNDELIADPEFKRQGAKGGLLPNRVIDSHGSNVFSQKLKLATSIEYKEGVFAKIDFAGFIPTFHEIMELVDSQITEGNDSS